MATCKDCLHFDVCKYRDEKVSIGTKVEELVSDDFTCFKNKDDFAEVKHGEWAWIADDSPMCTYCGKVFDTTDDADAGITWLFCPNCGALMDGGKNVERFD